MEQLIYEINGKKYLLMEDTITDNTTRDNLKEKCKRLNCIPQGIKDWKPPTLWKNGRAVIKVLVPEENVMAFTELYDI